MAMRAVACKMLNTRGILSSVRSFSSFLDSPHLKKRHVPIQLLQSGDRGGEGLHADGVRLLIDTRTRKGPFFHRSLEAGAWCATHYNNMYHARCVHSREEGGMSAEYEQLTKRVAVVNVAVERQIQVKGPDAEAFVDMVITRKASSIAVGKAKYVIICNSEGGIVNDPVLLRPAADEFWFSLADSNAGLFLQGVNAMGNFDVTVREIDVAPLSIAGPLALDTVRTLIGDVAADIPYFGLHETEISGCSVVVTRTGFSSEPNFEIFLRDAHRHADVFYNAVMAAGAPHGIREIAIPHHSRIEGGLLSYGQDIDLEVNPYECGLGWQVNLKKERFIGKEALQRIKNAGVTHKLCGLKVGGRPVDWYPADFYHVRSAGDLIGYVTSMWWSPDNQANVALAFLPVSFTEMGTKLEVCLPEVYAEAPGVTASATVVPVPFKDIDSAASRTGLAKTGSKL